MATREQQEIINTFKAMQQELRALARKINELEMEVEEHTIVLNTLKGLEDDRRCYRLIGGVLVERTVAETRPEVQTNHEGVGKVIKQLAEQFAAKEKELLAFQAKHNIQVRGGDGPAEAPAQQAKSQGVLV